MNDALLPRKDPDFKRGQDLLLMMWRIRAFEEAAERAQRDGKVRGALHQAIGQEAVAAAICLNLRRSDMITSNHRGHGHTLAKGADMNAMMAELFGKATGTCQGKGGSMHIADFKIGMLGANGVVAAGIPIAVGAAHATRLKGRNDVTVCFFGDGAVNRGPFLEGLNWAKIFALPVLFVCEDNGYAATTDASRVTGGPGAQARAESLGVPSRSTDGNDAIALDGLARELIEQVRREVSPQFLHVRTYRLKGHTTADKGAYRDPREVKAREQEDPISRLTGYLAAGGTAPAKIAEIEATARREAAAAVQAAETAPWPDPKLAYTDVQDIGSPARRPH
jgi:acetoin:2,6-dichlorophenolindophenol oxidoreductase subunit alpha